MLWKVPNQQKLVAFLQSHLGNYSNKFLRKLLEANLCKINGKVERFGSCVVNGGDLVELAPEWKAQLTTQPLSFPIIYEDEWLKIVDKPPNWVCAEPETKKAFGPNHHLIHRLDKDTTGLLMLAKSKQVLDEMIELFEEKGVAKKYLCLVDGIPKDKEGMRKSLLMKKGSFQGQTIWGSGGQGLMAITHWKKLASGNNAALIAVEPETGRTHQIRVHMAEMGHPILIDRQYAKFFRSKHFFQRPLLHAHQLQFSFREKLIEVTSSMPQDMIEAMSQCNVSSL